MGDMARAHPPSGGLTNEASEPMTRRIQGHLRALENEAIHVMREVAAQFERPVLLFSGGKDSIVLSWVARKAFHPAPIPRAATP